MQAEWNGKRVEVHSTATPGEQKPEEHSTRVRPATPLPWPNEENTGGTRLIRGGLDAIYARHAANAYPRLVEALKNTGFKFGALPDEARALLRELGEL
jgi:hypothetical protein